MEKYMTHEEFLNCYEVSNTDMHKIDKDLKSKNITNINKQLEYVEKNYDGQHYIYFLIKTLNNIIIENYSIINAKFTFSKSAIIGLLSSHLQSVAYMQERLPEHVFYYNKTKISTFVYQLIKQFEENKNLKDI